MTQERLDEKKASRNGRREDTGLALQAPAFCRPACPVRDIPCSVRDKAPGAADGRLWRPAPSETQHVPLETGRQGCLSAASGGLSLTGPVSNGTCRRHKHSGRRGSQVIEYALVIAALSAAFTTMFVYGKRGIQGVIRTTVDKEIGPQADGSPAEGFASNESMQSRFESFSGDNSRAQMNATGVIYDIDSFSSSSGVATQYAVGN